MLSALVFQEKRWDEFTDAQPMTCKTDVYTLLSLPCGAPDMRHNKVVNRLRRPRIQVVHALPFGELLRPLVQYGPDALGELFFQGQARALLPRPRVTFGHPEMLLAEEGRLLEVGLWIRLGVSYCLASPQCSLEGRGVDGSEARCRK